MAVSDVRLKALRKRRVKAQARAEALREQREEIKALKEAEAEIKASGLEMPELKRPETSTEKVLSGVEHIRAGLRRARGGFERIQEHGEGVKSRMGMEHTAPRLETPKINFDLYDFGKLDTGRKRKKRKGDNPLI